eukprot:gene19264-biopygen22674
MPVWKCGSNSFFSNKQGKWVVTDSDNNHESGVGFIMFDNPHEGHMPDIMAGCWKSVAGGKLVEDTGVSVTRDRRSGAAAKLPFQVGDRVRAGENQQTLEPGTVTQVKDGKEGELKVLRDAGRRPIAWKCVEPIASDCGSGPAAAPDTLWLVSKNRNRDFGGFYRLVADREVNRMPMWKNGENCLYSAVTGRWMVTVNELSIAHNTRGIKSTAAHGGIMPDAVARWDTYGDERSQEDSGVSVTSDRGSGAAAVPGTLRLVSTTRHGWIAGLYRLVPNQEANGMPMWECGKNLLYSSTQGEWCFAQEDKHIGIGNGFKKTSACMRSAAHGGLMPDAVTDWVSYDREGREWREDTGISVTNGHDAAVLHIVSTTRNQNFAGFYRLVPDRMVNGMPVWKCGEKLLYSVITGKWMVADGEETLAGNNGFIQCPATHRRRMPYAMAGWQSWDDKEWQDDGGISVTSSGGAAVPQTVRLVSTTRLQERAGFYHLVPDQQANGMPVWGRDKKWLYSTIHGFWMFADEDGHIGMGKDFAIDPGDMRSAAHGGLMPDAVSTWESYAGWWSKWQKDAGVSVTSERGRGAAAAQCNSSGGVDARHDGNARAALRCTRLRLAAPSSGAQAFSRRQESAGGARPTVPRRRVARDRRRW